MQGLHRPHVFLKTRVPLPMPSFTVAAAAAAASSCSSSAVNSVQCGGQRVVEWLRVSLCVCVRHCLDGKSMAGVSKLQLTKEENYAESVLKKESAAVACVHVCVAAAGHTHRNGMFFCSEMTCV